MLRGIRNRILLYNLALVLLISGGLMVYLAMGNVTIEGLTRVILATVAIAVLLSTLLSLYLAATIVGPIQRLTEVVDRMAQGDESARMLATRRDEVGRLIAGVNIMMDGSARRMAELGEDRRRLATVLDHMADGVIFMGGDRSTDGRVELINPAATRLLEIPQTQALGRSFAQVVRDYRLIDMWRQSRAEERPLTKSIESFGDDRFLRVSITPVPQVRVMRGEQPAYLVILQDLTQVRRLETTRRDFVSNISHELRTPLASLRALADTLRDGALDDPPAAIRFLDRIDTEVDSLNQMVQELLELSRIESGRVPFRMQPTDLRWVLGTVVERLAAQAERMQVALLLDLSPDLPMIHADGDRLSQVVTNLVHNAIKFTPAGGRVQVRAAFADPSQLAERLPPDASIQGQAGVLVQVLDTGVGIPSGDLTRIFERFFKADRARSSRGTGLGLAIAKHVVQAHRGQIWATSVLGTGSTFSFVIPTPILTPD